MEVFWGTAEDGDFERLGTAIPVRHPCALSMSVGWLGWDPWRAQRGSH